MRDAGGSRSSVTAIVTNAGALGARGAPAHSLIDRSGIPSSLEVVARPRPLLRRSARYASTSRFNVSGYRLPGPRFPSDFTAARIRAALFVVSPSMRASVARTDAAVTTGYGEDLRMTCRDGEEERILLRLVPAERIDLERDRDHALAAELHAEGDVEREVCEDSGDDRGDGDDGPDRCHDDGGGRGSRFLVGQLYPLFLDR
jgi:hypothetical protein